MFKRGTTSQLLFVILTITAFCSCHVSRQKQHVVLPDWLKGKFMDDYGIGYSISDSLFVLEPSARYHILQWNEKEQWLLVKNDDQNPTEKGLYSRIDYMKFENMAPYGWGFCLIVYDAKDSANALQAPAADRLKPKQGCNGFPFSRMKRPVN